MRDQAARITIPTIGSVTSATPSAARTTKPAGIRPLRGGEEVVLGKDLLALAGTSRRSLRDIGLRDPFTTAIG